MADGPFVEAEYFSQHQQALSPARHPTRPATRPLPPPDPALHPTLPACQQHRECCSTHTLQKIYVPHLNSTYPLQIESKNVLTLSKIIPTPSNIIHKSYL